MKQKTKNKITFEVRKKIHNLATDLPQVPFFIPGKNGHVVQRIATGKRISGADLVGSEFAKKEGDKFNPTGIYIQTGSQTRMMNHKVNLNKVYQDDGEAGVEGYAAYVYEAYEMISKTQQLKAEQLPPITDAEAEILIEEAKINDTIQANEIEESENK